MNSNFNEKLKKSKVIITTHYLVYGPSQALREYLINKKIKHLFFVGHPLSEINKSDRSYFESIKNGKIITKKNNWFGLKSFILTSIYEPFLTCKWVLDSKDKYDLFVGSDNLNALTGLILKKLGRVKKVIYYTIDYFPKRFENKFLNFIYYQVDKFCVRFADETWNLSYNMALARQKSHNMNLEKYNRQKTVPFGVWFKKVQRKNFNQIKKHQLLFVGHLVKIMGVDLAIRSIPKIIKEIPDFHFLIIGGGEEENNLKKLTQDLNVASFVHFTGWVKDKEELNRLMSDSAIGLAAFNTKILDERVRNADPAKIKDYLLLGMPVILTDAPASAAQIEKNGCGIVIKYETNSLAQAIIELMKDLKKIRQFRANAIKYIKQFDWEIIFSDNLDRLLEK